MSSSVLEKLSYPPFIPMLGCSTGKAQTLMTSIYPGFSDPKPFAVHQVVLPDQDKLVLMEYLPLNWKDGQRIVILVHGLTGDFQSKYNVRLTKAWLKEGFAVIRVNLRGCGPGAGLARFPYHSGRSEDTRAVIQWLHSRYPLSPVTQVGFSLGGNITLKMAAEDADKPSGNLDSIIAISPPVDLHACSALLHKPDNQIFEKYFVQALYQDACQRRSQFPDIPELNIHPNMSLLDFDNAYTAPFCGYKDAIDYYTRCSSGNLLHQIKIPTFILYAKDDPFITIERFIPKLKASNIDCLMTEHGGHVAWFGSWFHHAPHLWMDGILVKWLKWYVESKNQ
jgi:uncharacterized protein